MKDDPAKKYISEFHALEDAKAAYFDTNYHWYDVRRRIFVFLYRFVGALTIAAGLAIPIVTTLKDKSEWVVSVLSFAVAAGTSLSGFFAWQASWQKCVTIQLHLEHAEAIWRIKIANATTKEAAAKATTQLFDVTKSVLTSEAARWFSRTPLADDKTPDERND
jgi:ABC-type multidrug transport system fused ATPase/permease subunit